jgi:hypothetical protein
MTNIRRYIVYCLENLMHSKLSIMKTGYLPGVLARKAFPADFPGGFPAAAPRVSDST